MVTYMLPRLLAAATGPVRTGVAGILLACALVLAPAAISSAPAPKEPPAAEPVAAPPAAAPAPKAAAAGLTASPAKVALPSSLPDFTLPDLAGKAHASKDWRGQVVLVDFWATWCAGCRETIPALSRLQEKYGARGLKVVGISLDKGPKAKVGKFTRKLKMNYQVLLDSEDALSKVFGFEGLPSLYLFDKDGKLVKALAPYTALQDKELESLVAARFP